MRDARLDVRKPHHEHGPHHDTAVTILSCERHPKPATPPMRQQPHRNFTGLALVLGIAVVIVVLALFIRRIRKNRLANETPSSQRISSATVPTESAPAEMPEESLDPNYRLSAEAFGTAVVHLSGPSAKAYTLHLLAVEAQIAQVEAGRTAAKEGELEAMQRELQGAREAQKFLNKLGVEGLEALKSQYPNGQQRFDYAISLLAENQLDST